MSNIAIVTDSNSGISQKEAALLGIHVLPMPFYINDQLYFEDISLTQDEFYTHLEGAANITTSQPAPGDVMDLWNKLLKEYDEIVHIPMSSGLSGACATAAMLAEDYDGKVQVVDNQRVSVTQKQSVLEAMQLAQQGLSAAEIKEKLIATKMDASIYIMVDTLEYLKKGGRLTPAVAAIGTLLRLKPVLQIQGEKLDAFKTARSVKLAKKQMIEAVKTDAINRFGGLDNCEFYMAHTNSSKEIESFRMEAMEALGISNPGRFMTDPLSLSISCHIGPGALAITCIKKNFDLDIDDMFSSGADDEYDEKDI